MAWALAGIVDGRALPLMWFEPGSSVNRKTYLVVLKEKMWPTVRSRAQRNGYYYQQDRTPLHSATEYLQFLEEHFPDSIISRRTFRLGLLITQT